MSNDINETSTTPIAEQTTTLPPEHLDKIDNTNLFTILHSGFIFIMSRFFLLFFGIFVGVGIVVKFSPETKNLKEQVKKLESENQNLKIMLKEKNYTNWGDIKNSIILKK